MINKKVNDIIGQMVDDDTFASNSEDNMGFCTACAAEAYNVEPDAREYKCESCGENKVYGLEELLIMGYGL